MPSRQVMGIYTEGVEEEKLERVRGKVRTIKDKRLELFIQFLIYRVRHLKHSFHSPTKEWPAKLS